MSARTVRERRVYEEKLKCLCTVAWRGLFAGLVPVGIKDDSHLGL
jgi:hypothetical protein